MLSVPDAGQPVCSQPKHAHQQHQYSCSILNVVVQFASNSAQTEQPDHLQRAEQTADALQTGRKAEAGVSRSQRLRPARQFCFTRRTVSGWDMHLHTRLHVHTAFTLKLLMQSQIQTRVSCSLRAELCP